MICRNVTLDQAFVFKPFSALLARVIYLRALNEQSGDTFSLKKGLLVQMLERREDRNTWMKSIGGLLPDLWA